MEVTGKEIAKRLNISRATVSLVLNNRPGVNSQTRAAVFACREELMREAARTLTSSKTVYLLNSEPLTANNHDLFLQSYTELFQILNTRGYLLQILVYDSAEETFQEQLSHLLSSEPAGLIVFANQMAKGHLAKLKTVSVPMILFDQDYRIPGADNILIDNVGGILNALELFQERKATEIYYLAHGEKINFNFDVRRQAMHRFAKEHDLAVHQFSVGEGTENMQKNCAGFLRDHTDKPLSLFLENIQVALNFLRVIQQMPDKYHFPEDIFPVCFDELPDSLLLPWPIPMICISHADKAREAALRLVERMEEKATLEITYSIRTTLKNV